VKEAGLFEMNIARVLIPVLTLTALSLFVLSYGARTNLWREMAARSAHLDDEELKKRDLASGGLYLVEILALAAACFLYTVSLRILGLTGIGLWLLSSATGVLVALVLAPVSLRQAGRRSQATQEDQGNEASRATKQGHGDRGAAASTKSPPFPRIVLAAAERMRGILLGSPGTVDETGRRGVPVESKHGRDLLRLLLRLRERRISEVMVSRIDMICADESSTVSEVADLVREAAYNRIPVFSGTIDSITGYVTAKDVVIRLHQGGRAEAVSSIARKPVSVLSDATIEYTLEQMQKAHVTLAIVTDRSGKTAGLVTGEDILEEVVGDLYEDYQPEEPAYQVIDDRRAIVRANVALGDLKEILGAVPSADLSQTLGDYVRKQLGVEPSRGERVSDDVFSYSVVKTTGKTIWSLKVEKRS
jgi:Mg2+/Co2+ transporter CorC